MKTHLHQFAAVAATVAGLATASSALAAEPIHICTFPGSPSAALDKVVAQEAFKTAGIAATFVADGIPGGDDDDGVSLKALRRTLGHGCDVLAGFPRSSVADAASGAMRFSRGYLRTDYVSVEASTKTHEGAGPDVVAATYGSPSQLIAVQEQHVRFDLENTPDLTIQAVASGRATRAIVWYPAVVAYQQAHEGQQFDVRKTRSPYSNWQLSFAFSQDAKALQKKVDRALGAMVADGRLDTLTHAWALPASIQAAQAAQAAPARFAYMDGPVAAASRGMLRDAAYSARNAGHIVKISDAAAPAAGAPSFDNAQIAHGKSLYGSNCAKCHGANMQGITAPALSGPAFAPASGSHLTIGGIYTYMSTNMPADRPGKLKDDEYADIMAYLLSANGYGPGKAKMTADSARGSTTLLNAGPLGVAHAAK
ncbi:c-type cytochrome [Trinickia dinghuensis]|uniref:Cytochrome C n=1 Tax=Trinickia dinghuensis TaxID=2291023 RepID=A0A3D8JZX9_9BURK|nr:c-type cytochrome [Trinickia dinghuensis]RDU98206.1 cytochrome C [Trinickia dinghuensis]